MAKKKEYEIKLLLDSYSTRCKGDKEQMLELMLYDLWRNHPEWPSTFGPCHNPECGMPARGSGLCKKCVTACIREISDSGSLALDMLEAIEATRTIAARLRETVSKTK
jgi:hypothetical protein